MSYLSSPHGSARVPRTQRAILGDVYLTRPRGGGGRVSLGDTSSPTTSADVKKLQQQLNRYTTDGGAPLNLLVAPQPLQVTGVLDRDTASRAVWILSYRAGAAQIQWNDQDSKKLITEAMGAWSDPIAFVNKNLARVTQIVKTFADKSGIPAAKGSLPVGLTPTMIAAGLTIGGLLLVWRFR